MKNEKNEFIIRFRRKLIIWEVVKCIFASVVIAIIIDTIIVKALFESISHLFALILGTIFNYPFAYFLYFRPKIKSITANIWNLTREESVKRIKKIEMKRSNQEEVFNRTKKTKEEEFERERNNWQEKINRIRMYEPV